MFLRMHYIRKYIHANPKWFTPFFAKEDISQRRDCAEISFASFCLRTFYYRTSPFAIVCSSQRRNCETWLFASLQVRWFDFRSYGNAHICLSQSILCEKQMCANKRCAHRLFAIWDLRNEFGSQKYSCETQVITKKTSLCEKVDLRNIDKKLRTNRVRNSVRAKVIHFRSETWAVRTGHGLRKWGNFRCETA